MKKALSILAIVSVVAGLAITALPAFAGADDINRYGTREYWEWYNAARRQIGLIPWWAKYDSVLFFDHFYADGALDGRNPDESYYGGAWADASGKWRTTTTGVGYGFLAEAVSQNTDLYTGGYFDLGTVAYPVFYNFGYRALQLFETGTIKRGWTIRQGNAGALNVVSDCTSADETIIIVRSWDAAGNTATVATGHTTGIQRPGYFQASLVIEDTGSTLTVYWDFRAPPGGRPIGITAATHVLTTWTEDWQNHTAFGFFSESGSREPASDWVLIKQFSP